MLHGLLPVSAEGQERNALAIKLVDAKHDFTRDEGMVIDAEKLPWGQKRGRLARRWRKQVKYDLLSLKLEDTPDTEAKDRLKKRYRLNVENWEQTEDGEKLELYLWPSRIVSIHTRVTCRPKPAMSSASRWNSGWRESGPPATRGWLYDRQESRPRRGGREGRQAEDR